MTAEQQMVAAVARRIAKRENGEAYEGYESTHREAAEDYVRAAIAAATTPPPGAQR
jgi:hypothetical protein